MRGLLEGIGGGVLAIALTGAVAAQTPVGTSFTYQGRLTDAGTPASGSFDFRFTLFDAPVGGVAVGAPVTVNGIAVAEGLFASALDFGPVAFAGQGRWVQVEVKPTGGGAYTTLAPRQELTPAPYALFSSRTDPANLTSLNAGNLTSGTVPGARLAGTYALALNLTNAANTMSGTFTGVGSALTGLNASSLASGTVPSAVVAGTYSNGLNLSNPANVFVGNGAGLTNLNAQARYVRTVVVGPVGTQAQNGSALLAALAGITTASAANPWVLKIEPGTYDVGTTSFVMKPFVDVEGSGETVTKITGQGSASNTVGTVQAVTNSELRFLRVENTGGAAYAKALFVDAAAPRISHVTVFGVGGSTESQGFFAQNGATPTVHHLTANASAAGAASSFGVINLGAGPVYFNLNAFANGGSFAVGVGSYGGATPIVRSAIAIASGATTENQGVAAIQSSPAYENVVAIATGNAINNLGCLAFGTSSNVSMRLVTCRGNGATSINHGLLTNGGANATVVDLVAEASGGAHARGAENNGAGGGTTITHARVVGVGGSTQSVGLLNDGSSPRIVDVDAFASGTGTSAAIGVRNLNASPLLLHVTATAAATGTGFAIGVNSALSGSPTLEHVVATASGGGFAYGVNNNGGAGSRATLRAVTAAAFDATSFSIGVFNVGGNGAADLTDVSATAAASAGSVAGVYNDTVTVGLTNVKATTAGSTATRFGLINAGSAPSVVTVDRSTLAGSVNSILNQVGSTVRVAASQLAGPVGSSGGGTTTCLFSYSGSYGALNAACQ